MARSSSGLSIFAADAEKFTAAESLNGDNRRETIEATPNATSPMRQQVDNIEQARLIEQADHEDARRSLAEAKEER